MLFYLDLTIGFMVVMLLLSLLIMILVQAVLGLINLRGRVLQWGVERLIAETYARAKDHAGVIAKAVVEHPLVREVSVLPWARKTKAIKKDELASLLKDLVGRARENRLDQELAAAVLALEPVADSVRGVQDWFETVMSRTTELFVKYTRWITITLAFVLAFTLRVDAIYILQRLSVDSELRTALVQSVDVSLELAERHQDPLAARSLLIRSALAKAVSRSRDEIPEELFTSDQALDWIQDNEHVDADAKKVHFRSELETLEKARMVALREDADQIRSIVGDIVHVPGVSPAKPFTPQGFLGCLLGALLLSLGAPFWFNSLRSIANLRPMLAKKADTEE